MDVNNPLDDANFDEEPVQLPDDFDFDPFFAGGNFMRRNRCECRNCCRETFIVDDHCGYTPDEKCLKLDEYEYYSTDEYEHTFEYEESDFSGDEAEEVDDEQLQLEVEQAKEAVNMADVSAGRVAITPYAPTLTGVPDILLEKIFHYANEKFSDVCVLETVCKRFQQITTDGNFYERHPLRFTRELAFEQLREIRWYKEERNVNEILDVLGGENGGVDTLRDVSVDILSKMTSSGQASLIRLRVDTVGYFAELLQVYTVEKLNQALMLSINSQKMIVDEGDVTVVFRKDHNAFPFSFSSGETVAKGCNVGMKDHGRYETFQQCSCSLSSSSGTVWRWPDDNCHDVLPPGAGRRIIRRLAYKAGIVQMSNDAFVLAEAELLHTMGTLLVESLESSVKMEQFSKATFLGADEELVYGNQILGADEELACDSDEDDELERHELTYDGPPTSRAMDMWKVPPPPIYEYNDNEDDGFLLRERNITYTLVPGQIVAAAEKRNIPTCKVYGNSKIPSSGQTWNEEMEFERSLYCKSLSDDDFSDDESIFFSNDELSDEDGSMSDGEMRDEDAAGDDSSDEDSSFSSDDEMNDDEMSDEDSSMGSAGEHSPNGGYALRSRYF